jgi:hypothetical protein
MTIAEAQGLIQFSSVCTILLTPFFVALACIIVVRYLANLY